jgi:hypothetical protein
MAIKHVAFSKNKQNPRHPLEETRKKSKQHQANHQQIPTKNTPNYFIGGK